MTIIKRAAITHCIIQVTPIYWCVGQKFLYNVKQIQDISTFFVRKMWLTNSLCTAEKFHIFRTETLFSVSFWKLLTLSERRDGDWSACCATQQRNALWVLCRWLPAAHTAVYMQHIDQTMQSCWTHGLWSGDDFLY